MKKEKHRWEKARRYINLMGDKEHHYYIDYLKCKDCPAQKECEDE